jgi:hypothetical protein
VAGGFATVIHKGEREAGTILVVLTQSGASARLFERMPDAEMGRKWRLVNSQDTEKPSLFQDYLDRRTARDPDLWIVELDIADGERFIGLTSM